MQAIRERENVMEWVRLILFVKSLIAIIAFGVIQTLQWLDSISEKEYTETAEKAYRILVSVHAVGDMIIILLIKFLNL